MYVFTVTEKPEKNIIIAGTKRAAAKYKTQTAANMAAITWGFDRKNYVTIQLEQKIKHG